MCDTVILAFVGTTNNCDAMVTGHHKYFAVFVLKEQSLYITDLLVVVVLSMYRFYCAIFGKRHRTSLHNDANGHSSGKVLRHLATTRSQLHVYNQKNSNGVPSGLVASIHLQYTARCHDGV